MKSKNGFTLVEMCCVVAIISTLLSTVMPMYSRSVVKAKESALKENLTTFRKLIDDYYKDNEKYPENLTELVASGYLRSVPPDPFTKKNDTWVAIPSEDGAQDMYDVKSGAEGETSEGIKYSDF